MIPTSAIQLKFVWDFLLEAVRAHSTARAELFQKNVENLHTLMLKIHKDYSLGFIELKSYLEDNKRPTHEILHFLRVRRAEYAAVRKLATNLATELEKAEFHLMHSSKADALTDYAKSIINYFVASSSPARVSWYSHYIESILNSAAIEHPDPWECIGIAGQFRPRQHLIVHITSIVDY